MATKKSAKPHMMYFKGQSKLAKNTGKPCGRKSATTSSRAYPACRPTKAQCNSSAKKKKGPKRISWKKKT